MVMTSTRRGTNTTQAMLTMYSDNTTNSDRKKARPSDQKRVINYTINPASGFHTNVANHNL